MSEVILEDRVWNDEEIADYYKATGTIIYRKLEQQDFN
jgi:hypothetical protein